MQNSKITIKILCNENKYKKIMISCFLQKWYFSEKRLGDLQHSVPRKK